MYQTETDWTATLTLREHPREPGGRVYTLAVNLPLAVMNSRVLSDLRMSRDLGVNLSAIRSLEEMAKVLHQKKFRREMFLDLMRKLGGRMADHLEDAEGWHGEDRQERTRGVSGDETGDTAERQ